MYYLVLIRGHSARFWRRNSHKTTVVSLPRLKEAFPSSIQENNGIRTNNWTIIIYLPINQSRSKSYRIYEHLERNPDWIRQRCHSFAQTHLLDELQWHPSRDAYFP
jgi:hypothetical protein